MGTISKYNIFSSKLWAVVFMGLFLALAPCSVRNTLQRAIGQQTTESLVKFKASVQYGSSCSYDYYAADAVPHKVVKTSASFGPSVVLSNNTSDFDQPAATFERVSGSPVLRGSEVPLYLLYKRLKYAA
ncbi:hypothetical protein [Sunxiuqinia rutila]|uniref:hypothetical protein n=1 Tax=Sunxiuqinia rutila TaxID=1397841 RepID=UPI003D363CF9